MAKREGGEMTPCYALYSGGKDSTSVVQYLAERNLLLGVVSFDTGISAPGWLEFIGDTAKHRGWPLEIYKTPVSYDALVLKYGFPGPGAHGMFMNYLKGRCVRQFKKAHPRAVLASGVRSGESNRRFVNTKEWSDFEGVKVWAPIYNWTTEQAWDYFNSHGFERSPVYQSLCISGDCLCGAYATKLERVAIQAFYPEVFDRIAKLEKQTGQIWGWGAFRQKKRKQMELFCADCESPSSQSS